MKRETAQKIVAQLAKVNGPQLSLLEAMAMTPITTDEYEMFAIQKGDVTFLAWIHKDQSVSTKIICW